VVSALKHSEDGDGFVLRFYEAAGADTHARIEFSGLGSLRAEETDILERPLAEQPLTVQGNSVMLPVGHNQIVTVKVTGERKTGED
jgi:alpha-mannosidase